MRYAARAIIIENGKLLAFERTRTAKDGAQLHYLSIPGGQVEEAEQPEAAVVRELREELLIDVAVERLVAHVYMSAKEWYHSQEHMIYVCKRVSGEPHFNAQSPEAQLKTDDTYTLVWRSLDKLDEAPQLYPLYRPVLQALLPYLQAGELPEAPIDIDVANLL